MKGFKKLFTKALAISLLLTALPSGAARAAADFREDFQDESYVVGADIEGVNGWSGAPTIFTTQYDPDPNAEPKTNKVLYAGGTQQYKGAGKKFDEPISNLGYKNLVEVSFRMYTFDKSGGAGFELKSGTNTIFRVGRAGVNNRGTVFFYPNPDFWADPYAKDSGWNDGNLSNPEKYYILKDWVTHNKWNYFRIQIDFNEKKITNYTAQFEITDEMMDKVTAEGDQAVAGLSVVRDMPFANAKTTENTSNIDSIYFKLACWNESKAAWDDVFAGLTGERIDVTNIEVSSPSDAITEDLGAMQMSALITPDNASNKEVIWSVENCVDGTKGRATISPGGMLTAVENGKVRVKAEARDGSGVYGEKIIQISGQNESRTIVITSDTGSFNIDKQMGKIQLRAMIPDPSFEGAPVVWSVNNVSGKAALNQQGLVRALENGVVSVSARAEKDGMSLEGTVNINISNQLSWLDTPAFTETFPTREEVFAQRRLTGKEGEGGGTFEDIPGASPRWSCSGEWATVNNQLARPATGAGLHVSSSAGLLPAVFRINQAFKTTADIYIDYNWNTSSNAVASFSFNGYTMKAHVTSDKDMELTLSGGGINQTVTGQALGRFLYTFIAEDDGFVSLSRSALNGDSPVTLFETFAPEPIAYGSSANDIAVQGQYLKASFNTINVYYKDMSAQLEIKAAGSAGYKVEGNRVTAGVSLDRSDDRSGSVFGSVVVITAVYGADNRMLGAAAQTLNAELFADGAYQYEQGFDVADGGAVSRVRMSVLRSLKERAPIIPAVEFGRI